MTAEDKRNSMDIIEKVLKEIEDENEKYYIYPNTKICKITAKKLRELGYRVNMECIRHTIAGDFMGYKISWEKEYEDLGQDDW